MVSTSTSRPHNGQRARRVEAGNRIVRSLVLVIFSLTLRLIASLAPMWECDMIQPRFGLASPVQTFDRLVYFTNRGRSNEIETKFFRNARRARVTLDEGSKYATLSL